MEDDERCQEKTEDAGILHTYTQRHDKFSIFHVGPL